jgi:Flp pilus assembly secretin CpaC
LKDETLHQLQDLVDQKIAVILAQPCISTVSGVQAQVKSVRELIYPAEFSTPNSASSIAANGTNVMVHATAQAASSAAFLYPGTFKTRELGSVLNVTPTVSADGRWINLTLIPEISQPSKLGFLKHETMTLGGKCEVSQPDIYSWNLTTSVTLKTGTSVLLAVLDPVSDERYVAQENVVLVVLTAAVNTAE